MNILNNPDQVNDPVTAKDLHELLDRVAKWSYETGRSQKFGRNICPFASGVDFTYKKQGRDRLSVASLYISGKTKHEIHFPSTDRRMGDFSVAGAIFTDHPAPLEYDYSYRKLQRADSPINTGDPKIYRTLGLFETELEKIVTSSSI